MILENPFAVSASRKPERTNIEEKEYQNRMNLGSLWNTRRITTEALRRRGIYLNARDVEEYANRREAHESMKGSEEAGLAEAVFLEGVDTNGMTKGGNRKPYAWFSDAVVAYPAHPHDDVLRGTDAVLMFIDQDDERLAHPVGVDVTMNRFAYDRKFVDDLTGLGIQEIPNVYWAETAGRPGEYLDEPKEGVLEALNVSIYLPPSDVMTYLDPSTSNSEADRVMERLGPYVLRQFQSELEAQALTLLRLNPKEAKNLSQKALVSMLEAPESGLRSRSAATVRRLLSRVLPSVWDSVERVGGRRLVREDLLPAAIQERPPISSAA